MSARPSRSAVFIARTVAAALSVVVVGAFHLLRCVPEKIALRACGLIGRLMRSGMKPTILARLRLVLGPDGAAPDGRDFWRQHTRHLGGCVVEPVYFYWMSDAALRARVSVAGEEHLRAAQAGGRGAVLLLNHLGNPGAIVAGLGLRGHDLTIAGNRIVAGIAGVEVPLNALEALVQRMFRRGGVQRVLLGDRLPHRLTETLARNGLFAMFTDFPVVQKHNHLADFGHARMPLNLGPFILALRHRATVLCVTCRRVGDNHHQLHIHPPLPTPAGLAPGPAAVQLLQAATDLLVKHLRACPEQWWPWDWARIEARRPSP